MYIKELTQNFTTKREAFDALKESLDIIISEKKSKILKGRDIGYNIPVKPFKPTQAIKGLDTSGDYYHIVVSTTNVIDSHGDLHVKGCFNKTAKEQVGKVSLCVDHQQTVLGTAVRKEHVKLSIIDTTFKALGFNLEGETQGLVYSFKKEQVKNAQAKEWLESGDDIDASIKMQYINIELALKSDDPEDENEYKNFKNYEKVIANKSDIEDLQYFWIVKELKNVGESSLVAVGSNKYTGVYEPSQDTQKDTQNIEPSNDTQASKIDYSYLIKNL